MTTLHSIGSQIKALRISEGLTQSALAHRLRVSRQYVSGVEAGKEVLSLEQIQRFADAFGARVEIALSK